MEPIIHIYYRSCPDSGNYKKEYPEWFSKKACYNNLLASKDHNTRLTIFFDGNEEDLFHDEMKNERVIFGKYGNDQESYLALLKFVQNEDINENDIVYFLEDDYLHRNNWCKVLREGLSDSSADIITLYDHPDKYQYKTYEFLHSKIELTANTHWRATPSTTNTFAMRFKTLNKLKKLFNENWLDHEKFSILWEHHVKLFSAIPGYSTHCLKNYLSPVFDWSKTLKE